jgi:hypothetical protein
MSTTNVINERVAKWLATLNERSAAMGHVHVTTFATEPLRKYVRINATYNGAQRHVHAFYNPATGDVYKAAGWKAPAKGVRFNLLDDVSYVTMLAAADPYGSYLYY